MLQPRIQIESAPDSLRVVMPSRKIWQEYSKGALIGSSIILTIVVAEAVVVTIVFVPGITPSNFTGLNWLSLACLIWVFSFPASLVYLVYFFIRMATSSETLEVNSDLLTLTRKQFGISHTRKYSQQEIRNFQNSPIRGSWHERTFETFGITPGSLEFKYKNRRVRFGTSLDDDEANYIFDLVRARFPDIFKTN